MTILKCKCGTVLENVHNSTKFCITCKKTLRQERNAQYRENNKEYFQAYKKNWRNNNSKEVSEKQKDYYEKNSGLSIYKNSKFVAKKYGYAAISDFFTYEEFKNWYANKEKACEICSTTLNLKVDHCHKSGKPRGILCNTHNTAEGILRTPENCLKLLAYMQKHKD